MVKEKQLPDQATASVTGGNIHEHVKIKERDIPKSREELYELLELKKSSITLKNLDTVSEELLLGNARFCMEHGINFKPYPNVMAYTDIPLRYEVLTRLLDGKRPVTIPYLMMSVNNLFDLWNLTDEDKIELLDVMQSPSAEKFSVSDDERDILELRFGLNQAPGEDHPHTLRELSREHKIKKAKTRELENKAFLACKEAAFGHTKAFQSCKHWVEHAVELEVPGYVLAAKVLRNPLRAPSGLLHAVKSNLLDEHWDDIPAGVREAGKDKLMAMPLSDIIRAVLKRKGDAEDELLVQMYKGLELEKPDSQYLMRGNPDSTVTNLDWCKNKGLPGTLVPSTLVLKDLPTRYAVKRAIYGDKLSVSTLEKSLVFVFGQMHVTPEDISELLDCLAAGSLPDGKEVPGKYRITDEERDLLNRRFNVAGDPLRITDILGGWRSKASDYLRWLENTALLAACSDDMAQLEFGKKIRAYQEVKHPPDVAHDDKLEIKWLVDNVLTQDEKKVLGVKSPTPAACGKMGWKPIICEKKSALRRAYELRKAADAGWFNQDGSTKDGADSKVEALGVMPYERGMIADFFTTVTDIEGWSELKAQWKAETRPRKKKALGDLFRELDARRNLGKKLSKTEKEFLDCRCRIADIAKDEWVRGDGWEKLNLSQSRASQLNSPVMARLAPFIPKDVSVMDEVLKKYGSPSDIPLDVLESFGMKLSLEYRDWSEENERQWRSEHRYAFTDQLGMRSFRDLTPEELLQNRLVLTQREHRQSITRKRAGVHGYLTYHLSVKNPELRLSDMPREKFPDVFESVSGELVANGVDIDKILVANRFRRVKRPQGTFVEDIPHDEFRGALIKAYGDILTIPPGVMAEHGLELTLNYGKALDSQKEIGQWQREAERELRPVEPREVEMEDIEASDEPAAVGRKRRKSIQVPRAKIGAPDEEEPETSVEVPEEPPLAKAPEEAPSAKAKEEPPLPPEKALKQAPPEKAPEEPPLPPAKALKQAPPAKAKEAPPPEKALPHVQVPKFHEAPTRIPHVHLDPIRSFGRFDQEMHTFSKKFGNNVRTMMSAIGAPVDELNHELGELPHVRRSERDRRAFEANIKDMGWLIPTCAVFIRTQSTEEVDTLFDHLEASLAGWQEKGIKAHDVPRMQLYYALAHHIPVSAGIATTGDVMGNRYLKVGREYRKLSDELIEKSPSTQKAVYGSIHNRYIRICNAMDPGLLGKLTEADKISLPGEGVVEAIEPEKIKAILKPPEPEKIKPLPVLEEPKDIKLPPLSLEDFDKMLTDFGRGFKNRGVMMQKAGLYVKPMGAFKGIRDAGGDVREEGEKIFTFIPYIRTERSTAARKQVLEHLEDSFGQFDEGLIKYMEDGTKPENLSRLALYRVLACEIGLGEKISKQTDEVGKRYHEIGERYKKLAAEIPDALWEEYAEIEDKYLALVKEIYPSLQ